MRSMSISGSWEGEEEGRKEGGEGGGKERGRGGRREGERGGRKGSARAEAEVKNTFTGVHVHEGVVFVFLSFTSG